MLLLIAFKGYLSGLYDLGESLVSFGIFTKNTKDIPNSINVHCWTGSEGPPNKLIIFEPKALEVPSGPGGDGAPNRIFLAALNCDLWEQDAQGKGN